MKNSVDREGIEVRTRTVRPAGGFASFGVVLFHSTEYMPFPLAALTSTFYLGVPVFLMMSSMCLLLRRLDDNPDLGHYFRRRIARIWPIYYGSLVAFYLLFRFPFWDFVRYLFFVEYYVNPSGFFPVSVFWTLQLEEAMYLFIPLIHKFRWKPQLGAAFIVVGFIFLSLLSLTPLGGHPTVYFQMLVPVSLIAYGFGILAYCGNVPSKLRWLSVTAIAAYVLLNLLSSWSIRPGYFVNFFTNNVLLYSVALLGLAAIVANPPRFLGWFTFLGEESYALYALHYAFVTLLGLTGIVFAVVLSFLAEFALRPREISRRLSLSYTAILNDSSALRRFRQPPLQKGTVPAVIKSDGLGKGLTLKGNRRRNHHDDRSLLPHGRALSSIARPTHHTTKIATVAATYQNGTK